MSGRAAAGIRARRRLVGGGSPQTFSFTGAEQTFIVPTGVTSLIVDAQGAQGSGNGASEGKGARCQATLAVTPGETLRIYVGGQNGFNGGGDGTIFGLPGSLFGGGASDIRQGGAALSNRKIIAGGGGCRGLDGSVSAGGVGGHGGGTTGQTGVSGVNGGGGGGGGTQSAGGAGGAAGNPGTPGEPGGAGSLGQGGGGIGGGGGYYGGGGGGSGGDDGFDTYPGGGGGGGSNFAGTGTSNVTHTQGFRAGNGQIIVSYVVRATRQFAPPITYTQARARATQVTPTGVVTDGYKANSPVASSTFRLENHESQCYNDYDSLHNTGQCVAECGTDHGTASKAYAINNSTTVGEVFIIGGKSNGMQSETIPWQHIKHGRTVSNQWNMVYPDGPWDSAGLSSDGDAITFGQKNGSWSAVAGHVSWNCFDGVQTNDGDTGDTTNHSTCYIENCYFGNVRDTCVVSESGHPLRIWNCWFDQCYGMFDVRTGPNVRTLEHVVESCVIYLKKLQGGFHVLTSMETWDEFYKEDANAPGLRILNSVIAMGDGYDDVNLPADGIYSNVKLCWVGTGSYPGTVHAGCTLYEGAAATTVYNDAVADWKTQHGFTSRTSYNLETMLAAPGLTL